MKRFDIKKQDKTTRTGKRCLLPFIVFALALTVVSCRTNRSVVKEPLKMYGPEYLIQQMDSNQFQYDWFSVKYSLDLIVDKKKSSFSGQIRIRRDSLIWITLSPALGIEMARLMITYDSVFFLNRINKSYFAGDFSDVYRLLGADIDYDIIQAVLMGNDLTFYDQSEFRASYDSKLYHLVTSGRGKLKKYIRNNQDASRVYIQNIYLDPESFKILAMKVKEIKQENLKLEAEYKEFAKIGQQLFPEWVTYDISTEHPVHVDVRYSRADTTGPLKFPFKISSKYAPIHY
ncbi:MAG: hypothetical protein Kow00127_22030 [Bacteroidales bacterium]